MAFKPFIIRSTLALLLLAAYQPLQAQTDELLSLTADGTSKATTSVEAAREIQAQVQANTARQQVIDMIGEKRYQKNKSAVESKIVRQSAKFIPYLNPGQPTQLPDGTWKMPVEMKVSIPSLRRMVLEAGIMNDAEGPASILPMVAFVDRTKNGSVRWWLGSEKGEGVKFLTQLERGFHDKLQAEFSRQGFHMVKPQQTQNSPLPEAYRVDRPSGDDLAFLGEFYKTSMIMRGDIRLTENRDLANSYIGALKIQVVQAATGRLIAEVARRFTTDVGQFESVVRTKFNAELPDIAKDLSVQVLEAWQRGTINAKLLRLSIRGNLNPKQLDDFKSSLMRSVREVKGLTERHFERGQVVYEVDYTGDAAGFANRLKALQMPTYETRMANAGGDEGLALDVKAR